MPFVRKSSPAQSLNLTGQIPQPPPKVPEEIIKRFPDWADYQKEVEEWWGHFSDMLQRDRSDIQAQFSADEASVSHSISGLQSAISSLASQISQVTVTPAITAQFAALSNQLAALSASLSNHIGQNRAHGTLSRIVGETDTEKLDNKTIGSTAPGYGRFIAGALGFNQIDFGVTIAVTVNDFLVTAGPVDVAGSLVVDGTLVAM